MLWTFDETYMKTTDFHSVPSYRVKHSLMRISKSPKMVFIQLSNFPKKLFNLPIMFVIQLTLWIKQMVYSPWGGGGVVWQGASDRGSPECSRLSVMSTLEGGRLAVHNSGVVVSGLDRTPPTSYHTEPRNPLARITPISPFTLCAVSAVTNVKPFV